MQTRRHFSAVPGEVVARTGEILIGRTHLALMHGLYDRPDGKAQSRAELARAAVPYARILGASLGAMSVTGSSLSLNPHWVQARRRGRQWEFTLQPRGRDIVELQVRVRIIGLGSYTGMGELRKKGLAKERAEVAERRWQAMLRDKRYGALTAAAEALITAWSRVTPQEAGMYASLARGHYRKALEEFVRDHVIRFRALPTGLRSVGGRQVDFDALTWNGGRS